MDMSTNWKDAWKALLSEDVIRIAKQLETQPLSLVNGGVMKRFEKVFAKFSGTEYAVSTNNGTAAIYSALWAVGVRKGDEVLVCDYGFVAMAGAITTIGAVMVPVDIDSGTLTMDPKDLSRKITEKTKAVLIHNPWGVPAELDAIRLVTELPLILDASHAHGAMYKGEHLSKWADITCYSLGKDKLISGGELGCAVTNNVNYRDNMILLGHINRTPHDLKESNWDGNAVGLKFRPHVMALEIAMSQLKRFKEKKQKLVETCRRIEEIFSNYGFIPQYVHNNSERVYWRIVFHVDASIWGKIETSKIESVLKEVGLPIESNHYWPLLQHQSHFKWEDNKSLVRHMDCVKSQETVPGLITFPAPVDFNETQFSRIESALEEAKQLILVSDI